HQFFVNPGAAHRRVRLFSPLAVLFFAPAVACIFKLAKIHSGAPPWSISGYMSDAPAFTLAAFLSA
ncbi:hypothetical protein, partial [Comamonas aquatica]|uniref:hypothetical protein n=1 Tax=Comamonas aquatica TaxID=225991 RepID=UPI0034D3CA1E